MGVIIVDGYAFLRFTGRTFDLKDMLAIDTVPLPEKVKVAIETVPLPESPYPVYSVQLRVNGIAIEDFGATIARAEMAIQKLKDKGWMIDVCPPWPKPWPGPTPVIKEGISTWIINVRQG